MQEVTHEQTRRGFKVESRFFRCVPWNLESKPDWLATVKRAPGLVDSRKVDGWAIVHYPARSNVRIPLQIKSAREQVFDFVEFAKGTVWENVVVLDTPLCLSIHQIVEKLIKRLNHVRDREIDYDHVWRFLERAPTTAQELFAKELEVERRKYEWTLWDSFWRPFTQNTRAH